MSFLGGYNPFPLNDAYFGSFWAKALAPPGWPDAILDDVGAAGNFQEDSELRKLEFVVGKSVSKFLSTLDNSLLIEVVGSGPSSSILEKLGP